MNNETPSQSHNKIKMTEQQFWAITNAYSSEDESISKNGFQKFSNSDYNSILSFEILLREKIKGLNNCHIKAVAAIYGRYDEGFNFLDFRMWIVSKGQNFYNKIKVDPESMSDFITDSHEIDCLSFENLVYLADTAFEVKYSNSENLKAPREYLSQPYDENIVGYIEKCPLDDDYLKKTYPKIYQGFLKNIGK